MHPQPFVGGKAGVATQVPFFDGFPIDVISGAYDNTFDTLMLLFIIPPFSRPMAERSGACGGRSRSGLGPRHKAYFNIHTVNFPGGEIRGFLRPSSVPDASSTMLCLGIGLIGLEMLRRKFGAQLKA